MAKEQNWLAQFTEEYANKRYHQAYDNELYTVATTGKSIEYANALIDEALALCGSPYYKLSRRQWSSNAIEFLKRFA